MSRFLTSVLDSWESPFFYSTFSFSPTFKDLYIMPSLLSRLRRSSNSASSPTADSDRSRRSSTASSTTQSPSTSPTDDSISHSSTVTASSPRKSSSQFVEDFDHETATVPAPSANKKLSVTPSPSGNNLNGNTLSPNSATPGDRGLPAPIILPGTPKLVLTAEGSDSPHSFGSSPAVSSANVTPGSANMNGGSGFDAKTKLSYPSKHVVSRLWLNSTRFCVSAHWGTIYCNVELTRQTIADSAITSNGDGETHSIATLPGPPLGNSKSDTPSIASAPPAPIINAKSLNVDPVKRARSSSNASDSSAGRAHRSGSVSHRLASLVREGKETIKEAVKPDTSSVTSPVDSLKPPKSKKGRRRSTSSNRDGIGAALARSGASLANTAHGEEVVTVSPGGAAGKSEPKGRSPFLARPKDGVVLDDEEEEDEDDESGTDGEDGLSVSGFAVASARRNGDFHALFPSVDEGDLLIEGEFDTDILCLSSSGSHGLCAGLWTKPNVFVILAYRRLRLRAIERYLSARPLVRVGKSRLLPRQHLWLGYGCECFITS